MYDIGIMFLLFECHQGTRVLRDRRANIAELYGRTEKDGRIGIVL
jgi:hypothetical protein